MLQVNTMVTKGAVAAHRPNKEVIRDGLHVRQRKVGSFETESRFGGRRKKYGKKYGK